MGVEKLGCFTPQKRRTGRAFCEDRAGEILPYLLFCEMAGTDCGFDTSAGMGRVAEDVVWSKLAAMVEGARIASRRLFGR